MHARHSLARLRFEDPVTAAAVIDELWTRMAREEPRMFAALWRRANRRAMRAAQSTQVPRVEWVDEVAPVEVPAAELPAIEIAAQRVAPGPAPLPQVDLAVPIMVNPSPELVPAELAPSELTLAALTEPAPAPVDLRAAGDILPSQDLASF